MVTPINTYAHAASTTTRTQEMLDNILMLDKIKALQISQLPKDEVGAATADLRHSKSRTGQTRIALWRSVEG